VKTYLAAVLLSFPLLFSGCIKLENIELISIKDVTYQEFKNNILKLEITTVIRNPNRFNVKIKDANMRFVFEDRVIGTVTQVEHVEFLRKTQQDYKIHIAIEMKDLTSNLSALFRLLMNRSNDLSLSGSLRVKSVLFSKTVYLDKLSLK
jgi:hypothetical protein